MLSKRPLNKHSSVAKTTGVPLPSSLYVFANLLTESEADYKKGTRKERLSGSSPLSGGAGEIEAFAGPLSLTVILDAGPRRLKSGIEYRSLFF